MNSPIEEIKKAVAENRTSDALSRLLELTQSNKQLHDAIHIVLAEFNDLTSQRLKGTLDNNEATRRLNVIHDKILVALGAFDSQGRVLPGSDLVKKTSAAGMLGRITILLAGLGIVMLIIAKGLSRKEKVINGIIYQTEKKWTENGFFEIGAPLLFLSFCTFIAYLLAMVVSAFKK
jgi:hypothetical protein